MESTSTHQHHHTGVDFDPGVMYKEQWVKDQVSKIQQYLSSHKEWLGLRESKPQRVLDYACGHGTVSLALVEDLKSTTFQGLDSHPAQVQRYNDEAQKVLGSSQTRMFARVGDLSNASQADIDTEDWFGFDTIIMSMALHHVEDPVQMLVQLRKRLRTGGTLILVEWENAPRHSHGAGHGRDDHRYGTHGGHAHSLNPDPTNMIEAVGGQKVWPGFDVSFLRHILATSGFDSIDVRVPGLTFTIPAEYRESFHNSENQLMFAKAVVQ